MTTVVKFQDVKEHWDAAAQRWDSPEFVYIGRPNRYYSLPGSKWGNYPNKGIAFYKQWIQQQTQFRQLEELRGKTLVCWCKPEACHGDALVELLGETSAALPVMAISLWQPWATLVAIGAKQFETRHWKTNYRGDLVIHAAKKRDREVLEAYESLRPVMARMGTPMQPMVFGAALCVVRLVDCIPTEVIRESLTEQERAFGNYAYGRFAWRFEDVRKFPEPIPYRGQQGMWQWDLPLPDSSEMQATISQDENEQLSLFEWNSARAES